MDDSRTISLELLARVDALAARTTMTREEIIRDALENGRSLAWQEGCVRRIEAGIAAADRGEFARPEDIERVLNKYRPGGLPGPRRPYSMIGRAGRVSGTRELVVTGTPYFVV